MAHLSREGFHGQEHENTIETYPSVQSSKENEDIGGKKMDIKKTCDVMRM